MAVTVVGVGIESTGTGNVTPGLPSGWEVNDIHILAVATANESVTAPSGWTETAASSQGTGTAGDVDATRITTFWRRAQSGDTAPTVTDPGNHAVAVILGLRGCLLTGDPWDAAAGRVEAASIETATYSAVTTTLDNCLIVYISSFDYDIIGTEEITVVNAALSGIIDQFAATYPVGNGSGVGIATGLKATAGSIGSGTVTWHVGLPRAGFHGLITLSFPPNGDYTLASNAGAHTIAGTAAGLHLGRTLGLTVGSFTVDGTATDVLKDSNLDADSQNVWSVGRDLRFGANLTAGTTAPFCQCCLFKTCDYVEGLFGTGGSDATVPCDPNPAPPLEEVNWPIDNYWTADGHEAYIVAAEQQWPGCQPEAFGQISHHCNAVLEPGGVNGAEVVFELNFTIAAGAPIDRLYLVGSYSADNYVKAGSWKVNGFDQSHIKHGSYNDTIHDECISFIIGINEGHWVIGTNTIAITVKNGNVGSGSFGGPIGLELQIECRDVDDLPIGGD